MPQKALLWEEMKWPEIKEYLKECDIVLLPIGATEQHGLHLPCGTDFFNAREIAKKVSEKTGVIVAPVIPYGSHPYSHHYDRKHPATIPISETTQIELVKDIVRSLSILGFNKVIIINAHGQQPPLQVAMQEIVRETGVFVAIATWWELAKATIDKVCETPFHHADECETSVALALYPELVDMSKAKGDELSPLFSSEISPKDVIPSGGGFHWWSLAGSRPSSEGTYGAYGHPEKATREKGEDIVNVAVNRIAKLINELKERYPVGKKLPLLVREKSNADS